MLVIVGFYSREIGLVTSFSIEDKSQFNIHAFFYKEPVYKEPTCRRPNYLKNLYY